MGRRMFPYSYRIRRQVVGWLLLIGLGLAAGPGAARASNNLNIQIGGQADLEGDTTADGNANQWGFGAAGDDDDINSTLDPTAITNLTGAGTSVVIQSDDDITTIDPIGSAGNGDMLWQTGDDFQNFAIGGIGTTGGRVEVRVADPGSDSVSADAMLLAGTINTGNADITLLNLAPGQVITGTSLNAGTGQLSATTTGAGSVTFTGFDARLLVVDTSGGGAQTLTQVGATAIDDLDLTTGGTAAITFNGGTAIRDTDAGLDVIASNASFILTAGGFGTGTGAAAAIETDVTGSLTVDTSAGNGNQFVLESSGLTAIAFLAGTGTVDVTAGGALTDLDGVTDITASAADITLTTGALGSVANAIATSVDDLDVVTTNADQSISETNGLTAIELTAGTGVITYTGGGTIADADAAAGGDVVASGATFTLTAGTFGTGAASGAAIETDVGDLAVTTTNADQFIRESNGLTSIALGAGTGTITYNGGGTIADGGADVDVTAGAARFTLTAGTFGTGAAAGAAVETNVTDLAVTTTDANQFIRETDGLTALALSAGTGIVTYTGGGAIIDAGADVDVAAAGATFTLTAGGFGTGAAAGAAIETNVNDLAVTTANANQFILESSGLTSLNLAAGVANITYNGNGTVADGGADLDVAGNVVRFTLASGSFGTGAGAGASIETAVTDLTVTTVNTGQFIRETDGLTGLSLDAGAANILYVGGGAVADGVADVDVIANAASFDLSAGAFGSGAGPGAAIETTVADLSVTTVNANQLILETDGLVALDLDAGTGTIVYTGGGAVTDAGADLDVIAGTATFTLTTGAFGTGAGAGAAIETSVTDLTVTTTNANQFLRESNGITALNLGAGTGNVVFSTINGNITDVDGAVDVTGADLTFASTTAGSFGTAANPLEIAGTNLAVTTAGAGSGFFTTRGLLTNLTFNTGAGDFLFNVDTDADQAANVQVTTGNTADDVTFGGTGTYTVNGSLNAFSSFTSGAATTLTGSGTIGVNFNSVNTVGGALTPAGDGTIGAFSFNGDLTFTPTSVFRVDAIGETMNLSDRALVMDRVTADGTVAVNLLGDLHFQQTYVIAQGLSTAGAFDAVTVNRDGIVGQVRVDPSQMVLTLTRSTLGFADIEGLTPNQQAVGNALQAVVTQSFGGGPALDPDFVTLLNEFVGGAPELQVNALQDLAGEVRIGALEAILGNDGFVLGPLLNQFSRNRLGSVPGIPSDEQSRSAAPALSRMGMGNTSSGAGNWQPHLSTDGGWVQSSSAGPGQQVWVLGSGNWGDIDPTSITQGFEYEGAGFTAGYSWLSEDGQWMWGAHGGFQGTEVEALGSADNVEIDTFHGGMHGSYANEAGDYLDLVTGYVGNELTSRRFLQFGAIDRAADAQYEASQGYVYVETGSVFELSEEEDYGGEGWKLQPQVGIQYRSFEQEDYTERGAGAANLTVLQSTMSSIQTSLGARFFHVAKTLAGGWLVPDLQLRWVHEFGDVDRRLTSAFAGTTPTFTVSGPAGDEDAIQLRTGVTAFLSRDWNIDASYNGQFSDVRDQSSLIARASYRFD